MGEAEDEGGVMLYLPNLVMAAAFFALSFLALSLATYYALPPAGPGWTHVIDPSTGQWRRKPWVRIVAPFYETGQVVRYRLHLPVKRLP